MVCFLALVRSLRQSESGPPAVSSFTRCATLLPFAQKNIPRNEAYGCEPGLAGYSLL
jgi:hypothetical protein